jgi:hypothetical protein
MGLLKLIEGNVKPAVYGSLKKFLSVDSEGRLISAPSASSTYTQAYSDTSKVEVEHNLDQFPEVTVWTTTRGTAFGAGGFGVSLNGLSGGALPDTIVRLDVGFVLFHVDSNNFTVLFPDEQVSGYVEWREV